MKNQNLSPDDQSPDVTSHFPDVFDAKSFMASQPNLPISPGDQPSKPWVHPEMIGEYEVHRDPTPIQNNDLTSQNYSIEYQQTLRTQELENLRLRNQIEIQRLQAQHQAQMIGLQAQIPSRTQQINNSYQGYHPNGFDPIVMPDSYTAEQVRQDIEFYNAKEQAVFDARSEVMTGIARPGSIGLANLFNDGQKHNTYWNNLFKNRTKKQTRSGMRYADDSEGVNPTGL